LAVHSYRRILLYHAVLLLVGDNLPCGPIHLHFVAHFLNEHRLLFELRRQGINLFLLLVHFAMLLLAGFCLYSTALCALGTEEFANPPTPLPVRAGEQIAASLVDLVFLFDRVASDPPTATTPDYLERISQPSSSILQRLSGVPATRDQSR
jgi:hypothetical protein